MSTLHSPSVPAPAVDNFVARDRRTVRWLLAVSIVLWVAVLAVVIVALVIHFRNVVPRLDAMMRTAETSDRPMDTSYSAIDIVLAYGVAIVVGLVGILAMLTAGVVALLFASRRATLRQINASLSLLSRQLQEIQESSRQKPAMP